MTSSARRTWLVLSRSELLAMTSPLDGAAHLGHFLGPLVDEQHHEVHLGMIRGHGLGDVLQQDGLAGARRGDDQAALPLADGRQQVHDARGQRLGAGFQADLLVRVDGRQVVEVAADVLVRRLALDRVDAGQARAALPLRAGSIGPVSSSPSRRPCFCDERGRDVGVARLGGEIAGGVAQKAVALGVQFQDALGRWSSETGDLGAVQELRQGCEPAGFGGSGRRRDGL